MREGRTGQRHDSPTAQTIRHRHRKQLRGRARRKDSWVVCVDRDRVASRQPSTQRGMAAERADAKSKPVGRRADLNRRRMPCGQGINVARGQVESVP
eukprot:scaffold3978_cov112-Isochrysis_galbana.AAC.2